MRHSIFRTLLCTACFLHVSTGLGEKKPAPPPPEDTVVTVPLSVPSLAPLQETKPSQLKGGLRITVEPDTFAVDAKPVAKFKPFQPGFKEMFKIPCTGSGSQLNHYIKTYVPGIEVKPDHLVLHLHIDNQMPRVFRGSGALVQFNVAGKMLHINAEAYGELTNAIIPPRSSQDFTIIGPEVSLIAPHSTVAVNIFDVVTKMDQAGNIQEKQDFEWFYSYEVQAKTKDLTLPAESKVCLKEN